MSCHSVRRSPPDRFHGRGGPLAVTPEPKTGKLARAFLQAGVELGHDVVDPNAAEQMGEDTMGVGFVNDPTANIIIMNETKQVDEV